MSYLEPSKIGIILVVFEFILYYFSKKLNKIGSLSYKLKAFGQIYSQSIWYMSDTSYTK